MLRLKTNLRGLNELWLEGKRILLTDEEYAEVRKGCKEEVYAEETKLEERKPLSPQEIAQRLEDTLDIAERDAVEEIRKTGDVEACADLIYDVVDEATAASIIRRAR